MLMVLMEHRRFFVFEKSPTDIANFIMLHQENTDQISLQKVLKELVLM